MLLTEGIRPKRRMFGRELFASDRGGEYHDEEEGTGFQADLLCPGRLTYLFPLIRTTGNRTGTASREQRFCPTGLSDSGCWPRRPGRW